MNDVSARFLEGWRQYLKIAVLHSRIEFSKSNFPQENL